MNEEIKDLENPTAVDVAEALPRLQTLDPQTNAETKKRLLRLMRLIRRILQLTVLLLRLLTLLRELIRLILRSFQRSERS